MKSQPLTFSLDIGYASIGWSVIEAGSAGSQCMDPVIRGCGTVIFPKDDCQAFKRRSYRRLRRNIRSRRVRIERIGKLLVQAQIITQAMKDTPGHPAPFYLASEALQRHRSLSALELWHVLRWYAHNRGYDHNESWSNNSPSEENKEDTEKLRNGHELMKKHGACSMAETICRELRLEEGMQEAPMCVSTPAYKTLNTAFPRSNVQKEVREILELSAPQCCGLTPEIIALIVQQEEFTPEQRKYLLQFGIKPARRYRGGLLFGQLMPRFDNRIIGRCPITWAQIYETELSLGSSEKQAREKAEKLSKVPSADCQEFYEYRMARILCNLRADDQPLPAALRRQLMEEARKEGKLTKSSLKKIISSQALAENTNIDNYFNLHPDSEEALYLDPAVEVLQRAGIHDALSLSVKRVALTRLRRGKPCTPHYLLELMRSHGEPVDLLEAEIVKRRIQQEGRKKRKEKEDWAEEPLLSKCATGRAPYARPVLRKVVEEVLAGEDPSRPARDENHPDGEVKTHHGCLYCLLDPESKVNEYQRNRSMESLTNNHLVRHRMMIVERLLKDLIQDFAEGRKERVEKVCIEVARELSSFSGMDSKKIQAELNLRQKSHAMAVGRLKKDLPGLALSANLIRKCRIAEDMNWTCPFTLQKYGPHHLEHLELEHIVPHSFRQSNALSSLVLTWREVNKMKDQRTGYDFVEQCQGSTVPGKPNFTICSINKYKTFVNGLDERKWHADDQKRKKKRKALLMVRGLSSKNQAQANIGMTEGMMTQSSHLMKLASRIVSRILPEASIDMIPGAVTAAVRKSWDVLGCFKELCPETVDPVSGKINKQDLRSCTHLHHALDACVLGLIPHIIPAHRNGLLRRVLAMRRLPEELMREVRRIADKRHYILNDDGRMMLRDLPNSLKENIREKLMEQRVIKHVPSDMSGASLRETMQRVLSIEGRGGDDVACLRKSSSIVGEDGKRIRAKEINTVKANKLVGIFPEGSSKLKPLKAAIEIEGNYGVALDPHPVVIRHVRVFKQILALKKKNGGKPVRILKNGMLIKLTSPQDPKREGVWRIDSIQDGKNGIILNLQRPHYAGSIKKNHGSNWRGNRFATLLKKYHLEIHPTSYTGKPR